MIEYIKNAKAYTLQNRHISSVRYGSANQANSVYHPFGVANE